MITPEEKDYLAKIPISRKVSIKPFDPQAKKIGDLIVSKIKQTLPDVKVLSAFAENLGRKPEDECEEFFASADFAPTKRAEKIPLASASGASFLGATALGIAGQNDIDIYVLSKPKDFDKYLSPLKKLFGEPKNIRKAFVEWKFNKDGYLVELYLTEPPERQIRVFEILKSDKKLLEEYEKLKLSFNGKSFRDYQSAKYEFYNRILPTNAKDFLGKETEVIIDRPLGSKHQKHGFVYEANYGYVPNTKSLDGEELDAYYLGINKPIKKAKGICITVIHRTNDNDDKLVVVPKGTKLSDTEIEKQTRFQERWFKHIIIRK